MRLFGFALAVAALLSVSLNLSANELPPGKDAKEFMVGPTGVFAEIKGGDLIVTQVTPNTPAAGKLNKGDILDAIDGASLAFKDGDPRHVLGFAINTAEGRDGKMTFTVRRGGAKQTVVIQLEPIGSYTATFPADCRKSQRIVDDTAAFILKNGGPSQGINGDLEGLFLLSTGDKRYLPAVEKYALKLAEGKPGNSVWMIGYSGIFLGEYYLTTGDQRVLPALKARCDELIAGQYYGGWGHGTTKCVPGYVTGGLLNAAGAQALTTLVIARECGVDVDNDAYDDALRLFFRFAGHGNVPYGDHVPETWSSTNGKNGGAASAFALLPEPKFQAAAKLLALAETDSYFDTETGHGSIFGNQTWRNIVDALVIDVHPESYRRHKDKMIWYFELSRMPGGGFRTPWYPGYGTIGKAPLYQTGLIAMAYTAQLKHLRICGKPRTPFSAPRQPTPLEQSLVMDDFLRTDYVDGAKIDDDPETVFAAFRGGGNPANNSDKRPKMPVEWYAKIMRHYNPAFRIWAAHGLGFQGEPAIPEITKALASDDARLRVAGLDAISCTIGWSVGKTTSNITPEMIHQHFLPQICASLKNPMASVWEKRLAMMALSCCDAQDVADNLSLITPYLGDREWWLRTAAFTALDPLIMDAPTFRTVMPKMLASYEADTDLPSRRWGATALFKHAIEKNPQLKDEIVAAMADAVGRTTLREGFKQPIDLNNIYETLRYVNLKKNPEHIIPLLPVIEKYYPAMDGALGRWVVVGEGWGNIGLATAAARLGKDARPVIATLKRIAPTLEARDPKKDKDLPKAIETLHATIKTYEDKYGPVTLN